MSDRMDELEQRIGDVYDQNAYDVHLLEERIDALEQRIDFIAEEGSKYVHEYRLNILALAERIEKLERRLNHKSMDSPGESIKIAGESLKNGGGE